MKAELIPTNGDPPIPILRDVTVVGRGKCCDVTINKKGMSTRHCVLVKTDGLLVIRDLASLNGTKVNGQRVQWAALLPRDRVSIAGYKARIYLGPDNAPAPSELAESRIPARPKPRSPMPRPEFPRAVQARPDKVDPVRDAAENAWRGFSLPRSDDDPRPVDLD